MEPSTKILDSLRIKPEEATTVVMLQGDGWNYTSEIQGGVITKDELHLEATPKPKVVRNDDEPIGRTWEELTSPYKCYSFTKPEVMPVPDLPPAKQKEGRVPAYVFARYVKNPNREAGYYIQTQIFIPSQNIITIRPDWPYARHQKDKSELFRIRTAERIEYEQLEGSELYGQIRNINAITVTPRFIEMLLQHNQTPFGKEQFDEMCSIHSFKLMNSNYPTVRMSDE